MFEIKANEQKTIDSKNKLSNIFSFTRKIVMLKYAENDTIFNTDILLFS